MTDVAVEQQAAADVQPTAASGRQRQQPRFNCRIMGQFQLDQVENIRILKQRTGGTESSVLRASVDLLAFVNGLAVESDPSIFLNNYFAHQNGGTNGR